MGTPLLQGALIRYMLAKRGNAYKITHIHLLEVPFALAKSDILFVHHLLELCFFFLPVGGEAFDVFSLLMILYEPADKLINSLGKKIFIFKLLVAFGYYTSHVPLSVSSFYRLVSESIDSIVNSPLRLEIERNMDAWLFSSVGAHPRFKDFKTIHFLTKN